MLEALAAMPTGEAQRVLAQVTARLLPTAPGTRTEESPETRHVYVELCRRQGIEGRASSPAEQLLLLRAVNNEWDEVLSAGVDVSAVRKRLAARGLLDIGEYRIKIERPGDLKTRGLRRRDVERTLRSPDQVQHIAGGVEDDRDKVMLFARRLSVHERSPDVALVIVREEEDELSAGWAWRIVPRMIDVADVPGPMQLLKAFIDRYGVPMSIGALPPKLVWIDEAIPLGLESRLEMRVADAVKNRSMESVSVVTISALHVAHVSLSFTVDLRRYTSDLKRHMKRRD